ncbi:MAG: response regulator [Chloroflexi bacterium]|nr:response regulator [Chloroflexota bacterium]
MDQCRPLRVLIMAQQGNLGRVLATNIQCWGYEAILLPSTMTLCEDAVDVIEGDVLLFDLDEPLRTVKLEKKTAVVQHGLSALDFLRTSREQWSRVQFTIALASRSVSRTMLEQIGAVALLQKPFEMGRLQRYLQVLQRLVLSTAHKKKEEQLRASNETIRVLVVDDDVEVAHAIYECLIYEAGYEVAVAHEGLEALERCLDWHPHCIVTDLIMPWMNGYQVMRCLSVGSLSIMPAFVVMSALTQLEVPENRPYLKGNAVAYIDKPFHVEHLLTAIKQICA